MMIKWAVMDSVVIHENLDKRPMPRRIIVPHPTGSVSIHKE